MTPGPAEPRKRHATLATPTLTTPGPAETTTSAASSASRRLSHDHHTVAREDLQFSVKMALFKARYLWPKRRGPGDHDDARFDLMATEVVDHLELCGIRCVRKGPASPYGTFTPRPAPRPDGAAGGEDAGNG